MSGYLIAWFALSLFGLCIGIALTAAVGIDAQRRGRSGFLWALLVFSIVLIGAFNLGFAGLLFSGLLGTLIYFTVVLADDSPTDDTPETVRVCPSCSATHPDALAYCSECGTALDEDDDAPTASIIQSGSNAYCSNCKTQVNVDADMCSGCGAAVLSGDSSTDETPDTVRVCPSCSATHPDAPEYCSECGTALDEDDDAPTASVLQGGSNAYCSNCKSQVSIDADVCSGCGAALSI